MANLMSRLRREVESARRSSWLEWFSFNGTSYPAFGDTVQFTQNGDRISEPDRTLAALADRFYKGNTVVATLMFLRQQVFSTAEFAWMDLETRELTTSSALRILQEPWPGGTTQNLLAKSMVDVDIAGNSYWRKAGNELIRMRPDWVDVVFQDRGDGTFRRVGYIYYEGGKHNATATLVFPAADVAHFMPLQDPVNEFRGMSWLTPSIREVLVDEAASLHQQRFFEHAATPNLAVSLKETVSPEQFNEFVDKMDDQHQGAANAWKTLYLAGGADVTVVGVDLSKADMKAVQGRLETRLSAVSGVGAVVAQFSEGMQGSSLNAGNFGQARRRFADAVLDPLWREAGGSFQRLVARPPKKRLWVDTRHVPFLREDAKDQAEIFASQAASVRQLLDAGFKPDAAVQAASSAELKRLEGQHTGKLSVQLLPTDDPPDQPTDDTDEDPAGSSSS